MQFLKIEKERAFCLKYMCVGALVKIQGGGLNLFSVFIIPFFIFAFIRLYRRV
jgi:hypothetical protein